MSRFVRAHYKVNPKNPDELILNAKLKDLEDKYIEEEEKDQECDAGSSALN